MLVVPVLIAGILLLIGLGALVALLETIYLPRLGLTLQELHDLEGKLMPYAEKNNGLFEVKECFNEKTQWSGTQTLITPKGRETFRLLYLKA